MKLLIKNVRIVDESKDIKGDVLIVNGKIAQIGLDISADCETIHGENMILMPSFIDLHVHFREPGFNYKETIETGSLSALKGGYTFANLMGNTDPICSSAEIVDMVLNRSKELDLIDVHQVMSVTNNFDGTDLSHLDKVHPEVKFISDDGKGIISNITMYNAFLRAKELNLVIMVHAEDMNLTPIDYRISENIITFRDLYLSSLTNSRLHLCHVSTKEAIEAVREYKNKNAPVTCEVTPHHIALWHMDYKVNPPIREKYDVDEIINGILDGTVDAIATDHAPHTCEDKCKGAPGLSGLETSFSVCYTALVKTNKIDIKKLSQIMSANPARIAAINKGKIEIGYDGDLVLIDTDKEIVVDSDSFVSKGKNTPFNKMSLFGEIKMTIKNGVIKYKNN